jgi:hypothetical protein
LSGASHAGCLAIQKNARSFDRAFCFLALRNEALTSRAPQRGTRGVSHRRQPSKPSAKIGLLPMAATLKLALAAFTELLVFVAVIVKPVTASYSGAST